MDVGFLTINTFNESCGLSAPATIIRRNMDGTHCSAPNNVFGGTTVVGVSEEKSDYNYKTEFQIWKENN